MSEAAKLIFLRAGIAMLAAALGGLVGVLWKRPSHRVLCFLVSFAAGALLSVTVMDIIPEAAQVAGWPRATVSTLFGLIAFYLIGKYVYYVCPACAASATEHQRGYLRLGVLLMVALGIHSTVDGLAIAASTKTGHQLVAVLVLFAVSYHKIPEGLALVSVARLAGFARFAALGLAVLIELTTGLGAFIGLMTLRAVSAQSPWLGVHLGLVAGSFIYIVAFAIIREMMEHERRSIMVYLILGFVSIIATSFIIRWLGITDMH